MFLPFLNPPGPDIIVGDGPCRLFASPIFGVAEDATRSAARAQAVEDLRNHQTLEGPLIC
ncbi:hypothetical protein [Nannocystis pusilla]|uniref:hypothetical protein n=1 Tax=Nannocystis pusilla TaxID=889268 RepID=UPI003DA35F6A